MSSTSTARAAECFLFVVVVAIAEGIGREVAALFATSLNTIKDPAARVGVETAIASIPLALLHVPLLKSVVRPTAFALALLVFALAVGDGAAVRVASQVDPRLMALAGGAVVGIAFSSVLEHQGVTRTLLAVALGCLGMGARAVLLDAYGSKALVPYTLSLVVLWIPLGVLAFFVARTGSVTARTTR